MTPEEAIEILEEIKELDDTLYAYNAAYMDALEVALFALKEIQQYREIGTVEEVEQNNRDLKQQINHSEHLAEVLKATQNLLKKRERLLKEYYKIGTVEELARAKKYIELSKRHGTIREMIDECAAYEQIGTVEDFRETVDKLTKAEKTLSSILSGNYNDECNFCVHNNNPMANCQCISGDGSWCIHNAKWNGKISDIDNLEEVDNGT